LGYEVWLTLPHAIKACGVKMSAEVNAAVAVQSPSVFSAELL
jgi:hypothetical protein